MNELPPNPILEFNPNQIAEVRKLFNYEDINRLHQDLQIFEDWIKMQHHFVVKEYDREYLERYLICSKGSIERAKKLLDKICTLRGLMPEYLQGYDVTNELRNYLKIFNLLVLPKLTSENHRILYFSIHNPDSSLFEHIGVARYMLMIFHYLYRHDYNSGVEVIFETRNFTFGIISKVNPIVISNTLMIMTEALGLRLRGIHLISGSKFIDILMGLIKQGLTKKVLSRLHIHENFESLFNFIPKTLLPKDIGGDLDTIAEITEKTYKEFSSPEFTEHLKFISSATTNESERLPSKFNEEYSGMPGSFKVMTVD